MHKDEKKEAGLKFNCLTPKNSSSNLKKFKEDKVKLQTISEKKANAITFENFLNFFPEVELPYTITSDTQRFLSVQNDPLSATWMFNFVLDENAVIDEFTASYRFLGGNENTLWFFSNLDAPNGKILSLEINNKDFSWNEIMKIS